MSNITILELFPPKTIFGFYFENQRRALWVISRSGSADPLIRVFGRSARVRWRRLTACSVRSRSLTPQTYVYSFCRYLQIFL